MANQRFFRAQANWDSFPTATLNTLLANVIQAIENRLQGNGLATTASLELDMGDFVIKLEKLEDLNNMATDIQNAINKKLPGSTFTTGAFCE